MNFLKLATLITLMSGSAFAQTTTEVVTEKNPWKFGLNARYRWEDSNRYNLANRKEFSHIRIRPNISFEGVENLKVVLEPQFAKVLGAQTFVPTGAAVNTVNDTSGNSNYAGSADGFALRNAYMHYSINENLSAILGRQSLSYGDQYIIAASDWGVYGRTFDAARFVVKTEKVTVDVFEAKIVETQNTANNKGNDKNLYGLYATAAIGESIKALDVYGFYQEDKQADVANTTDATRPWHFGVYGTRFVTQFGSWGWKFEYAKNFGNENTAAMGLNKKNDMIDTQVDFKFGEVSKHKLGIQLFTAGENWRELYPTTFTAFGRTDVLGRRNLTGAGLHWNTVWSDLWTTDVDAYFFQRTSKDATAFSTNSSTTVGAANLDDKNVGSELDLNIKYSVNKNLSIGAGTNFFFIGKYLKDSGTSTEIHPHFGYLMLESKF